MEDKLMVTKGRKVRINLEYGINTHTQLHVKETSNRNLLYRTESCNNL